MLSIRLYHITLCCEGTLVEFSNTSHRTQCTKLMVECVLCYSGQTLLCRACHSMWHKHNMLTPISTRPHMVVEVVLACKVLQAGWTFERPLACVCADVVLEHMLAAKPLWAQVAVERLQHGG